MKRWMSAAVLVCGIALSNPTQASYPEGLVAYDGGQFDSALREFRTLAQRGHPGAEFMLGVMYFNGFGVERNQVIAAIYFRQAAEQGDAGAQLAFGSLHVRGVGVVQDLVEARKWLTLCTRSNEVPALAKQATAMLAATASLMTPDEIIRADRGAERWRPVRPGLVRAP